MTDILIRMEKPHDCGKCFVGDRTICADGCPLVELPEHGDLIDRDELNKCRKESCHGKNGWEYDYVEDQDIGKAAVIVPANKEVKQ